MVQRTANENTACWAVGLFRSDMLLIFNMVWPWFSCGTGFVCPQFPYRGSDMIFWIFPIVPCHAFCMWHWSICKKIWIWVSSEVITICIQWVYGCQSTSWSLHSLLHRADETQQGRNSCPRLQFGFQFGLYHVVAPLSFLRSISLASLSAIVSYAMFWRGWSNLKYILRCFL